MCLMQETALPGIICVVQTLDHRMDQSSSKLVRFDWLGYSGVSLSLAKIYFTAKIILLKTNRAHTCKVMPMG